MEVIPTDTLRSRIANCLQTIALDTMPTEVNSIEHKKVSMSTIHKAKGLEWPVVFLINANEGIGGMPSPKNTSALAIEEERRLMYVAMTRAKKNLYVVCNVDKETRFLKEIDVETLNKRSIL